MVVIGSSSGDGATLIEAVSTQWAAWSREGPRVLFPRINDDWENGPCRVIDVINHGRQFACRSVT